MKRQGLGNWERAVEESIEQLRMLRIFRKPQASHTFARMLMKVLNNCECLGYFVSLKRYVISQECFHSFCHHFTPSRLLNLLMEVTQLV